MSGSVCAFHRRRRALSACVSCGHGICRACIVPTRVGFKCPSCTGATPSRTAGRRWPLLASAAAAVLLVAGIGVALVSRGGEGPADGAAASGPVKQVPVRFEGAGGFTLHGTLDILADKTAHRAAVVIIPGFGATTRDGVASGTTGTDDPLYRDLGELLADAGFVVLRYDKRGTGESAPLPEAEPPTFDQRVEDAVRAVAYLRRRPEVDPEAVAVIGHDEGGLIGLRIADRALDLDALVLISTPGRPLGEVLAAEYRAVGDEAHGKSAEELERAVETLLETGKVPEVSVMLAPIFQLEEPGYLREVFAFDPAEAAPRVTSPVLIVHGEADSSITEEDVSALRGALTGAPEVEVLHAPHAGHTLAAEPADAGGVATPGASEVRPPVPPPSAASRPHGEMHPGAPQSPPARDTDVLSSIVTWLADAVGRGSADPAGVGDNGSWQPMRPASLSARVAPTAAWTGRELLVWGGASCRGLCDPDEAQPLGDGAAYDPAADNWRSIAATPLSPRFDAAEPRRPWPGFLFVWGGDEGGGVLADGAIYDPAADAWRMVAPSPLTARSAASAVWTGREVVVWGGTAGERPLGDGAAYDPATDTWRTIAGSPLVPRLGAITVWTGEEMVVWGGEAGERAFADGAAYDPAADHWRPLAEAPLTARLPGRAAWTGRELLAFGGRVGEQRLTDGAAYDPAADRWRSLTTSPAVAREGATSIWTDRELVVWGGFSGGQVWPDGAAYDPESDTWRPIPAWRGRVAATAAWADGEMLVWGGLAPGAGGEFEVAGDGARYRPDAPR